MAHENATPRPWRTTKTQPNVICNEGGNHWIARATIGKGSPRFIQDAGIAAANAALIVEAVNAYDTLRAENERLEAEVKRLSRLATDNAYMRDAYHAMLMPNGLKVAAMWKAKGVRRQHTSWGDNAWLLTGEERAQCILDWEALPRREVLPGELDGPALSEAQP